MKNSYKHQAAFLKKRRLKADLSQRELASMLGYSCTQTISNCERELQRIPFPLLVKLCNVLDIPQNDLKIAILKDKESDIDSALT